jgi:hypothetical protein
VIYDKEKAMKTMLTKYACKCFKCGGNIAAGAKAYYEVQEPVVEGGKNKWIFACMSCGKTDSKDTAEVVKEPEEPKELPTISLAGLLGGLGKSITPIPANPIPEKVKQNKTFILDAGTVEYWQQHAEWR